jgi:hypothetical protein
MKPQKPERLTDSNITGSHTVLHYGNNMLTPRSRSQENHIYKDEENNSLIGLVSAVSHSVSHVSGQMSSTSLALEPQKEQNRTVTPPLFRQSQVMSMVLFKYPYRKLTTRERCGHDLVTSRPPSVTLITLIHYLNDTDTDLCPCDFILLLLHGDLTCHVYHFSR